MQIVLFEDELTARLAPLAGAEPAFAITCGGYKLIQLISSLGPECTVVRKHLARVEAETFPQRVLPKQPLAGQILFVNARLVPSIAVFQRLKALADSGREGLVSSGEQKNQIAAALVNLDAHGQAQGLQSLGFDSLASSIAGLSLPQLSVDLPLLEYPHDVLRHHLACCREDLEHRIRTGPPQSYPAGGGRQAEGGGQQIVSGRQSVYTEVRDGVFVGENVTLGEHLVTDTKNGPIIIDHEATIGPFCFLRGPVYVGPCAKVNEHAALKDCVSLGHHTKVGGEVEGSIIEPFSNKQHHGFLGHSYVGSWVNIGAGTCNSDLKNTYGIVKMEYLPRPLGEGRGEGAGLSTPQKISTGLQFVGCFIGDYAKTAINTSIFTGKTIGVCSLVYGFVTTNVPSFCNYARSLLTPGASADAGLTDIPAEVMISIQQRMFARRQTPQRECDIQLIRDLYAQAQQERQLPHEHPAL
jgi:UDP-N-acetylglucosamine diphosphorylase / glucose-1-phosphate thymidylyltransferase / UDP-N-acetylgalactosamine diphosphorylase / glucosamine-1-phosphate N-acetyltransferase / galactosamine-1-phosphate N-acetyltransferase